MPRNVMNTGLEPCAEDTGAHPAGEIDLGRTPRAVAQAMALLGVVAAAATDRTMQADGALATAPTSHCTVVTEISALGVL